MIDVLIHEITEFRKKEIFDPIYIAVPNKGIATWLQYYLFEKKIDTFNIQLGTLNNLKMRLIESYIIANNKSLIPPVIQKHIVSLICETKSSSRDDYFHYVRGKQGFIEAINKTYKELSDNDVSVKNLKAILTKPAKRIKELFDILINLENMSDEYITRTEAHRIFMDNHDELVKHYSYQLFCYGDFELNKTDYDFIEAYSDVSKVNAYVPAFHLPKTKRSIEKCSNIDLKYKDNNVFKNDNITSLNIIQHNLFMNKKKRIESTIQLDNSVKMISVPVMLNEVRSIIREIIHLVRVCDYKYSDIAIALTQLDPYRAMLKEQFDQLGIPYDLKCGLKMLYTKEAKALMKLLAFIGKGMTAIDIISFVENAELNDKTFFSGDEDVDYKSFLKYTYNYVSAKGSVFEWLESIDEYTRELNEKLVLHSADDDKQSRIFYILEKCLFTRNLVNDIVDIISVIKDNSTFQNYYKQFEKIFEKIFSPDSFYRINDNVISILANTDNRYTVSKDTIISYLKEHLEEEDINIEYCEGVLIDTIYSFRGAKYKAVIVPGMISKVFPTTPKANPLFLDDERAQISSVCDTLFLSIEDRMAIQNRAFKMLISSATEKLILTYPRFDISDGKSILPSFYLIELLEAHYNKTISYEDLDHYVVNETAFEFEKQKDYLPVDYFEFDSVGMINYSVEEVKQKVEAVRNRNKHVNNVLLSDQNTSRTNKYTKYDGILLSEKAKEIIKELAILEKPFSTSILEIFARCPYQYFLRYILKAYPYERLTDPDEFDYSVKGDLIHNVLFTFYNSQEIADRDYVLSGTEDEWKLLSEIFYSEIEKRKSDMSLRLEISWLFDRELLLFDCFKFFLNERERTDKRYGKHFNFSFGRPGKDNIDPASLDKPVKLDITTDKSIFLVGEIDRIDTDGNDSYQIIDYKTGSPKYFIEKSKDVFASLKGGTNLQLGLYCIAWKQIVKDCKDIEAFYYFVKESGGRNIVLYDCATKEKQDVILELIDIFTDRIENGYFHLTDSIDYCQYCQFNNVCLASEKLIREIQEIKLTDPILVEWIEMRSFADG